MNTLLSGMQTKDALTANGAITHSTTQNNCLDLFFLAGACRNEKEDKIKAKLEKAYQQDRVSTIKIIFNASDIRGGAGERRFMKLALNWLYHSHKEDFYKIMELVPHFNRWDSLFDIAALNNDEKLFDLIGKGITESKDALLAKWLPRKGQYNNFAGKFRKYAGWTPEMYRKRVVTLSKTVEQLMTKKEWGAIQYDKLPSVASNKYRKAFYRNDKERFEKFIADCKSGEKKINASAIFPYDIYRSIKRGDNKAAIEVQWDALPNYLEGTECKFLPMCDVSESMTGLPMDISVSLGIYLSERNTSSFKDAFITFTDVPYLQILKGSLVDRANQIEGRKGYNTNLQAAFDLVLKTALRDNVPSVDMPTHILVISDMEFDNYAVQGKTNFEIISDKYRESGYQMPTLVFWNVNGSCNNNPVNVKDKNTVLVSGASPSIMKTVLQGEVSPDSAMKRIIADERYAIIEEKLNS